jgi:hypothetical protein
MKRRIVFFALACFFSFAALALAAPSGEDQGQFTIDTTLTKAVVESVDLAAMTAKLKMESGKILEVKLDPKVKNLDKIKPGDAMEMKKTISLLLYLKRDDADPQAYKLRDVQYDTTPKGKPVKYIVETNVSSAIVKNFDKKGRTITLEGADGKTSKYKLTRDVKGFSDVRKGDRIVAKYTESVAVMVKPLKEGK